MILGAAWTPLEQPTFLTAGRDKSVKIWQITDADVQLKGTINATAAVTAVACSNMLSTDRFVLAFGTEIGEIGIGSTAANSLAQVDVTTVPGTVSPVKTINQVTWRPGRRVDKQQIAVVSDDTSVRIYTVVVT
jgi:elongator complex protein 2